MLECGDGGCGEMLILGSSTLCIQLGNVLPFCYALTCGHNCRIYFTTRCEGFDFFCVYVHYKLWPEGASWLLYLDTFIQIIVKPMIAINNGLALSFVCLITVYFSVSEMKFFCLFAAVTICVERARGGNCGEYR
jgi:hypothetical protein